MLRRKRTSGWSSPWQPNTIAQHLEQSKNKIPESIKRIADVERRYGVFAANSPDRELEHTTLTSIIDPRGRLRVQYLGVRFDPDEFRRDLLSLVERP